MSQVKTPLARLSYARLHTPEKANNGKDKYSAMLIFAPGEDLEALEDAAWDAAMDFYGSEAKMPSGVKKKKLAKGSGWPFRDGEDQDGKDGHEEGGQYINVSTYGTAPKVVRKVGGVMHKVEADEIKSGDYVKVMLAAKGFKVDGNSGVTFYMGNVLFVKAGDALGGGSTDPNSDFDDDEDSVEAEDMGNVVSIKTNKNNDDDDDDEDIL